MNSYDNVLNIGSSSSSQNNQKKQFINYNRKIKSFNQLGINLNQDIKAKYKPIETTYQSQNSIVVKCCKYTPKIEQNQIQQQKFEQNKFYAVKISQSVKQEQIMLNRIKFKTNTQNYLQVIQVFQNAIVFEYVEGNLKDLISNILSFDTQTIIKLLEDCTNVLDDLQKSNIVHSDIKPENILYRTKNNILSAQCFVIIDFTSSFFTQQAIRQKQNSQLICKQTWYCRAPQWSQPSSMISNKIDIWGLGCVLFQCLTGQSLLPLQLDQETDYIQYLNQLATKASIASRLNRFGLKSQISIFQPILMQMLDFNPMKRPSIKRIKEFIVKLESQYLQNQK